MLIVSLCSFLLGLLLLALAMRGRVDRRGQFCRRCRFDLAGIETGDPGARCPECGSMIHDANRRVPVLRHRWRLGLGAGWALMLAGLLMFGFGISGRAGIVLRFMPDPAVLWLTEHGLDEALSELVVRVSDAEDPLPDELWKRAIADALAHQADQSQVWDPRWGEVLSVSFGNPIMTDAQMEQYIGNGFELSAVIRDRAHRGEAGVDVTLTMNSTRISSLNFNSTGYYLSIKPITAGVVGEEPLSFQKHDGMATNFTISSYGGITIPWNGQIKPTGTGFDVEPGTAVPVFIEYELRLVESGRKSYVAGHFRSEQPVMVLPSEQPLVLSNDEPAIAQQMRDSVSVSPLRVLTNIPGPNKNNYGSYDGYFTIAMRTKFESLLAPISLVVSLRFADGELVELGDWVQQDLDRNQGIIVWPKGPYNPETHQRAVALIDRLIEAGTVDVVFHTHAGRADHTPGIDRVLDIAFEIEDVSVEGVEKKIELQKSPAEGDQWFKPQSQP